MKLIDSIDKLMGKLKGKTLSEAEAHKLEDKFGHLWPSELSNVLTQYRVVGQTFSMSEDEDPTELGVEMEWMTPQDQFEEAFDFEPGKSAIKEGYLPIGTCLNGSGDPYFIKTLGDDIKVYRIPHDAINESELVDSDVEYICDLDRLFNYIETE